MKNITKMIATILIISILSISIGCCKDNKQNNSGYYQAAIESNLQDSRDINIKYIQFKFARIYNSDKSNKQKLSIMADIAYMILAEPNDFSPGQIHKLEQIIDRNER